MASGYGRPTWGTATCWPRSMQTVSHSAASNRVTSSSGPVRPPATASSRGSPWPTSCSGPGVRSPAWPTAWSSAYPRSLSTCPSPNPGAWPTVPRCGRRWPRPRSSSGTTGGSCSVPAGPSRWCLGWSRPSSDKWGVDHDRTDNRSGRSPQVAWSDMCGIFGVTGEPDALPLILGALHQLEYRGYDSAGVALVADGGIWRVRAADGTRAVADLSQLTTDHPSPTDHGAGIGHTRWATHGHPTAENAHPHVDCTGRLALVHNGIIENHGALRADLVADGHTMSSATDTEVMAHLIERHMAAGLSLPDSPRAALGLVRGAFSIAVVHADEPDTIVAARRSTPLVLGLCHGVALLASDIPALLGHARQLYALADDEIAVLTPGAISVTTLAGTPVQPEELHIAWDLEAARKDGYEDFMSKEMHEQPGAVAATLLDRRGTDGHLTLDEMRLSPDDLRQVDKVCIVACGSSYHAALVAKYAIEHCVKLPTEVDIASEFRYRDPVMTERTLCVGVSQSGETLDTSKAVEEASRLGAKVLVVTNVV